VRISIVTDELSNDPETAFELGLEWGVREFELRGFYDKRVPRIEPHLRRRLVRAIRDFGVSITAVSPGLFKIPFPGAEPNRSNLGWMDRGFDMAWSAARSQLADHLDSLLPETLDFAAEVGAGMVIAFSFERTGDRSDSPPGVVVEAFALAAETAARANVGLAIETEEGHWANTGARTAALVTATGSENLGVNWDPANALIDGDRPFPDGYGAVRSMVRNVHFKDVHVDPAGGWRIVEEGGVDWEGQIAALVADRYPGAIAIEPHLSPSIASTKRALERLRRLIKRPEQRAKLFQPCS
jgi:sugar phosphate isomerase/epimerase